MHIFRVDAHAALNAAPAENENQPADIFRIEARAYGASGRMRRLFLE